MLAHTYTMRILRARGGGNVDKVLKKKSCLVLPNVHQIVAGDPHASYPQPIISQSPYAHIALGRIAGEAINRKGDARGKAFAFFRLLFLFFSTVSPRRASDRYR